MSYRPITDVWILARPKVKYYGAYPNGFLERAIPLLGVNIESDPILHLCGGRAKDYPNKRLVKNAITVDADPGTNPDYVRNLNHVDAIDGLPHDFGATLIDPPYTQEDHVHYATRGCGMPTPNWLLRMGLNAVRIGGRVGMLHYIWPQPPKTAKSIAAIGVIVGFNNRIRIYSVFERIE